MPSLLRLDGVVVQQLVINGRNPVPEIPLESIESCDCGDNYRWSIDYELLHREDDRKHFCVKLRLSITRIAESESARFDKVSVRLSGFFSAEVDTSDAVIHAIVPGNCLAMLHGTARGIVLSATSAFPGGGFLIPAVNYVEVMERKAKALARRKKIPLSVG